MKFIVGIATFVAATHAMDQKRSEKFDTDPKKFTDEMFSNIESNWMAQHQSMKDSQFKDTTSNRLKQKGKGLDEDSDVAVYKRNFGDDKDVVVIVTGKDVDWIEAVKNEMIQTLDFLIKFDEEGIDELDEDIDQVIVGAEDKKGLKLAETEAGTTQWGRGGHGGWGHHGGWGGGWGHHGGWGGGWGRPWGGWGGGWGGGCGGGWGGGCGGWGGGCGGMGGCGGWGRGFW